jgi:hypothetical protein
MSVADFPPLDRDLCRLLENARGTEPAPPDVRERVFSSIADLSNADLPGQTGAFERQSLVRTVAPRAARRALPLALSFALGSAAGATAMRAWWSPPASPAPAPSTSAPPSARPQPANSALAPALKAAFQSAAPPPAVSAPHPGLPRADAPRPGAREATGDRHWADSLGSQPDQGFAQERLLLDAARASLARGEGASALASIGAHEHQFPSGILVQEREVLAVRALLALGQTDRAKRRAESFRARFPNSVLSPTLESVFEAARRRSPP